jgi:hypothetical protein
MDAEQQGADRETWEMCAPTGGAEPEPSMATLGDFVQRTAPLDKPVWVVDRKADSAFVKNGWVLA